MTPPAVTVVGEVVAMREALSWFETKPLFGWRILVPRTKEQAGSLSARLRGFGGVPEEVPTISVEPPRNPLQMDKAVRGLVEGRYEWIAFTSVNAVKAVREKFEEYGLDARAFSGLKIAAVGDKTAAAIADWGLRADLTPSGEQSAAGLLEDWPEYDEMLDPINRVFLPRADIATENLVAGLIDLGWECDDVTAYRTVRAAPPPAPVRDAIKSGKFDAVVFTSSSTVRNLVGIAGKPHPSTVIAVIGPATAKTAEEHGLRVDVLAPKPDVDELVDALADFGAARRAEMLDAGAAGDQAVGAQARRAGRRSRARDEAVMTDERRLGAAAGDPAAAAPHDPGAAQPGRRDPALARSSWCCRCSSARGPREPHPISSMPGVVQHTRDSLLKAAHEAAELGLGGVMLFGIPEHKDALGSGATDPSGILNLAITDVVAEVGDALTVMSDLCLDEFTDHGHCGVLTPDGRVDNDRTLEVYAEMALAQADAGVDMVGPSGMMDGQVAAIRGALDDGRSHRRRDPGLLREVRHVLLRSLPRGRELLPAGRPAYLPAGPRQRPRGSPRGPARRRRGRRHRDGQARAGLPRRRTPGARRGRRPGRGVQRLGGVLHGRGGRGERLDRPGARDPRDAHLDPPCRRRRRPDVLGRRGRPPAVPLTALVAGRQFHHGM